MAHTSIRGDSAAGIVDSVEAHILAGLLPRGAPLPTIRELAVQLRVSPTTVAAAYKALQARGFVVTAGRGGTRVARGPRVSVPSAAVPPVPDAVDLASGNPDPELLPPLDLALRQVEPVSRLYGERPLHPALAAIAREELAADGIRAPALTAVNGALDGIDRVLRESLHPGDRVLVEDPAYAPVLELLAAARLVPVPCAVDEEGLAPAAFAAALRGRVRAVIVTPRAQNPTGACMTADRARELRAILDEHPDVLLIEDDHAGPIAGAPVVTLSDPARPAWVVLRSMSKTLGPDLRVALLAGDPETVGRVDSRHAVGLRWVSGILQSLVASLWSDPSTGRRLARAADAYASRRRSLIDALGARGIPARGLSGLNVWIPVREETVVVQQLLERGWAVAAGGPFRIQSAPAIRVTVSRLTAETAVRFAADLADTVASRQPLVVT